MNETNNVFAYGTLMWPEVLEAVAGRRLAGGAATLAGYKRLRVKGEHYPAVVPSPGDLVEGVLYRGLTAAELACLDAFEGVEYDRASVDIGQVRAEVYVLSPGWRHIAEAEPWHPEHLTPEKLAEFCSGYKGWAEL